jgi:hypothetical protein
MLEELETIALTRDLPEQGLKSGDIGTIVLVYENGQAYEVEFMTLKGETLALVTLTPDAIRQISASEIAHARQVA